MVPRGWLPVVMGLCLITHAFAACPDTWASGYYCNAQNVETICPAGKMCEDRKCEAKTENGCTRVCPTPNVPPQPGNCDVAAVQHKGNYCPVLSLSCVGHTLATRTLPRTLLRGKLACLWSACDLSVDQMTGGKSFELGTPTWLVPSRIGWWDAVSRRPRLQKQGGSYSLHYCTGQILSWRERGNL